MTGIQRLRQKVIERDYYLSSHAEDEMWADRFERSDIENAIIEGKIDKRMTRDPRGTRYRVLGPAQDGRLLAVVCRLRENGTLIIITVYALTEAS